MTPDVPRAIAIVGPTASGKTALSLQVAREIGAAILSCDSMQIYRGMDIGTAKATEAEQAQAPHYLIDLLPPSAPCNAADYGDLAYETLCALQRKGTPAVFCGGTGLYLEAVRTGRHTETPCGDDAVRRELLALSKTEGGVDALYAMLCAADPASAVQIHKNNVKRVIRALEIFRATGIPKSEWDRRSRAVPPRVKLLPFYLYFEDRELLYARIDRRVDAMMEEGLLEEVRRLTAQGALTPETTASQAIGYKELTLYLRGACSLAEAVAAIKLATRHYAKRQMTWFSAMEDAVRVAADANGALRSTDALTEELLPQIRAFFAPA